MPTLALAFAVMPGALADMEEHWAYGVSKNGGWSDFNKLYDHDSLLCWAASSSNLINWWQNYNPDLTAQTNAPTEEGIWSMYRESFKNVPGEVESSLKWYFYSWEDDGEEEGEGDDEEDFPEWMKDALTDIGRTNGGYFDIVSDGAFPEIEFSSPLNYGESGLTQFAADFCRYLDGGYGVSITIKNPEEDSYHAITLWGAEYDTESQLLTRLWLTDSDDVLFEGENEEQLISVTLDYRETEGSDVPLMYLVSDYVREDGARWYDGKEYWCELTAIALYPNPLPEPAVAALFLPALVALSTRRRRKTKEDV